MILSAWDHPRAGLLPNDRLESRPPSAPSIATVLFQRIRLKLKKKKRFQFKILTIQVNVEIRLELVKRMAAHIEGISIKTNRVILILLSGRYHITYSYWTSHIEYLHSNILKFRFGAVQCILCSIHSLILFSPLLCMQLKSKRAHSPIHIYLDIWIMTKNK